MCHQQYRRYGNAASLVQPSDEQMIVISDPKQLKIFLL